jgi:hypothetical protein
MSAPCQDDQEILFPSRTDWVRGCGPRPGPRPGGDNRREACGVSGRAVEFPGGGTTRRAGSIPQRTNG